MKNSVRKKEELLQRIKKFRLLDDELMSRVFDENIECAELVLRIILGRPDIKVSEVRTKYYKENEKGVAAMSKIMEDFVEELLEQEKKEDKVKYAIQLKKLGKLTNEEIALSLGMTIKEVEEVDESAVVLI